MEPTTGKRIVSTGMYAVVKTYACLWSSGTFLCGLAVALLVLALPCSYYLDVKARANDPDPWFPLFMVVCIACLVMLPIFLISGYMMLLASRKSWGWVHDMEPFTRANAADFPALDSLLRASTEPMQAQEGVLLRAAVEGMETPPEQLVRASGGQG